MQNNRNSLITLLTLSSLFAIVITTLPLQTVNAQLNTTTLQKLLNTTTVQNLLKTGYTNQYVIRTQNAGDLTVLYSITGGTLVGIVANPALKAADIIINPGGSGGTLAAQIPRFALDAKNAQNEDVPFKVTLDGQGATWKQIQSTNTDRVLAIELGT